MQHQKRSPMPLLSVLLGLLTLTLGLTLPASPVRGAGSQAAAWASGQSKSQAAQPPAAACWSPTGQGAPCLPAGMPESAPALPSPNVNAACKVAVFYPDGTSFGQDLVNVLNTDAQIQATLVSQATIESGGLAGFNVLAARLDQNGPTSAQAYQAIRSFVLNGGGYVGEWWGAGAAFSGLGTPSGFNYFFPPNFLNLFSGTASDGFVIEFGHPITVTASHPVTQGLPSVFSAGGGTEFFVRAIPPFDPRLSVLATYSGYGGTNPAVMAGGIGSANVVLLLFDAIDNSSDPNLKRLWINSVKFACTANTGGSFDLCIQDDSNGNRLQINTATGEYQFTNCGGLTVGGTGKLTKRGGLIELQHTGSDRRLVATVDTAAHKATATLQLFSLTRTFSIIDRDTTNDTCLCN